MQKSYKQASNSATLRKWYRMCNALGWASSTRYLEVGFSNWSLRKDECGDYEIQASTTYHVESTLDDMYVTNFKNWRKK